MTIMRVSLNDLGIIIQKHNINPITRPRIVRFVAASRPYAATHQVSVRPQGLQACRKSVKTSSPTLRFLPKRVVRLENGIVALLISTERTRTRLDKEKTSRLSESSKGESCGEESDWETTDGTSDDCASSEDGSHVTSQSEDDTDVPERAAGGHNARTEKARKCQDPSIVVSVLVCACWSVTAQLLFF